MPSDQANVHEGEQTYADNGHARAEKGRNRHRHGRCDLRVWKVSSLEG